MTKALIIFVVIICIQHFSAQNLLNNGSFEYGGSGVGFLVDGLGYNELTPPYSGSTSTGNFAFVTDPQTINNSIFLSSGDHSSGNGIMMVIDGNTVSGQQRFWKAGDTGNGVCNLTVGQDYCFSYWIRTVSNAVSGNSELANIGVAFTNASNVTLTYGTTLAPLPNFEWIQVKYHFTATNSCVNIEMFNNNLSVNGNDFAIDDMELIALNLSLDFTYSVTNSNCAAPNSGMIIIYPRGGVEPFTFRVIQQQNGPITNNSGIFENLEDGTYTIGLMDALDSRDSIQNIVIQNISNIQIFPGDTAICPGENITFNAAGGNNSYVWNSNNPFETGFPDSTSSIIASPTINTIYEVVSNVNNANLIFNGDFQQGNIGFRSEFAHYAPSNPTNLSRSYGVLTNPSNWNSSLSACIDHTLGNGFGKMMIINGSTFNQGNDPFWCQTVAVEPNKDYLISYWATSLSDTNTAQIEIRINGTSVGVSPISSLNCSWAEPSHVWNSGNNNIAEICFLDANYQDIGNDFAIDDISFRSQNECNDQVSVTMANINPNYDVSYPDFGCINQDSIAPSLGPNYIAGGYYNVLQSGLNLDPISGIISTIGSIPGNYEITYTADVCGSFVPDTFNFILRSLPAMISLSGGEYNCQNQEFYPVTLTVNGTPDYTIFYTVNDSLVSITSSTDSINLGNIIGNYQLDSITDQYCGNQIQGTVAIDSANAPITPNIEGDSTYCYNSIIQPLVVTNAQDGIRWYENANLTNFLGSNLEILPNNQVSQTYYATQTINGCEGLADSFTVYINPCNLIIPTAFTPNNDGENDVWNIYGLDSQYPNNVVRVFNRWGELLYESLPGTYTSKPWEGKYKESPLPVGSYYYIIDLSNDNKTEPLNGIVSIILKK